MRSERPPKVKDPWRRTMRGARASLLLLLVPPAYLGAAQGPLAQTAGHDHGAQAPSSTATVDAGAPRAPSKGTEEPAHPAGQPSAPVRAGGSAGSMISIKNGEEAVRAYLAVPRGAGPHPAIIVIQEWWGLNDQIKSVADQFAARGYVALAPDLYRGKVTEDPNIAVELMRTLPEPRGVSDLTAAYAHLRALPAVGSAPIGSIGFCMGGHFSLLLAIAEPKLAACVICYGRPESDPAKLKAIGAPILGIYGGADKGIPPDMVDGFRKSLQAAGKSVEIKVFPTAGHGFMNPHNAGHAAEDTKAAWAQIDAFFAKHLAAR